MVLTSPRFLPPSGLVSSGRTCRKLVRGIYGNTSQNHPPPPTPQASVRNDIKLQESPLGLKKSYSLNNGSFLGFLPPTTSTNGICIEKKSAALKPSCSNALLPPQKHLLVVECFSRDSGKEEIAKNVRQPRTQFIQGREKIQEELIQFTRL